jgi:hypothetical protein
MAQSCPCFSRVSKTFYVNVDAGEVYQGAPRNSCGKAEVIRKMEELLERSCNTRGVTKENDKMTQATLQRVRVRAEKAIPNYSLQ